MGITFRPTEDHPRIAEAHALHAVDAAAPFGVTLDFSEASGKDVESVMRRAHGGTWGVTLGDEEAVALDLPVTPSNRQIVWPWYRVLIRFRIRPEDNVWHYYQVTVQDIGD
jgi:hypothetical protein